MKKLLAAALAAVMMVTMAAPAFASHWECQQSGEWMLVLDNGNYATNQWVYDSGLYYFVGPNGVMLRYNYTPDGYWVNRDGVYEAKWGRQTDETEPYRNTTYSGIYDYTFYKDTYGDGNVHWSMTESYAGSRIATYELYPMSGFSYEILDRSGYCMGYLSVDRFRDTVYVSMGNDTQVCNAPY